MKTGVQKNQGSYMATGVLEGDIRLQVPLLPYSCPQFFGPLFSLPTSFRATKIKYVQLLLSEIVFQLSSR